MTIFERWRISFWIHINSDLLQQAWIVFVQLWNNICNIFVSCVPILLYSTHHLLRNDLQARVLGALVDDTTVFIGASCIALIVFTLVHQGVEVMFAVRIDVSVPVLRLLDCVVVVPAGLQGETTLRSCVSTCKLTLNCQTLRCLSWSEWKLFSLLVEIGSHVRIKWSCREIKLIAHAVRLQTLFNDWIVLLATMKTEVLMVLTGWAVAVLVVVGRQVE